MLQLPVAPVMVVALMLCFGLRVMAIRYGWRLPVAEFAHQPEPNTKDDLDNP
jgi:uncharacterized membrane protein YeiH